MNPFYRFLHETPHHFVVHDMRDQKSFHVAKAGLSPDYHAKIKAMPLMSGTPIGDAESKQDMGMPKKYDDGGTVKPEKSLAEKASDFFKSAPSNDNAPSQDDARKSAQDSMRKAFGMSDGGDVLDANARSHIAEHNFALPGGRYPIHDIVHARNALARVSQHGTPEEQAKVRAAVHRKYPSIGHSDGGEVQSPEEAGIEAKGRRDSVLRNAGISTEQTPEEMEIEAAEKRRRELEPKQYADGGEIDEDLSEKLKRVFKTPPPPAPHEETQDEMYDRIRKENHERAMGSRASSSAGYSKGGEVHEKVVDILHKILVPEKYLDGAPSFTGAPDIGSDVKTTREQMLKINPDKGFADGGTVAQSPDFEPLVQQEMLRQGVNAGLPGVTTMGNVTGADLSPYRQAAETKVAQDLLNVQDRQKSDAAAAEQAKIVEQQAAVKQAEGDNSLREKAGLAPIPVPPGPPMPVQSQALVPEAPKAPSMSPLQMNMPDTLKTFNQGMNQVESGIRGSAAAQQEAAQTNEKLLNDYVTQAKTSQMVYQQKHDDINQQNAKLMQDVQSAKVDPRRLWNNKSTGEKIGTALGLIFGGIGSGLTHQPNLAAQFLENQVQQDIEAQKNDQSNKMSLYKLGLEKYKDAQSAEAFANLQANTILQGQIQQTAAKMGSPQAAALAKQAIGELEMKNAPIRQQLALQGMALKFQNEAPESTAGVNPQKLRVLIASGIIPEKEQAGAMKEYGDYNKLNDILNHTNKVFKDASDNATYGERILGSHGPTLSDKSKKYEAITNAWLGQITKDTEGRVTPQDIKLMESSLPRAGDSEDVIRTKLSNIKDMIREKYTFPTLKSYNLLNERNPVTQSSATRQSRIQESAPVIK